MSKGACPSISDQTRVKKLAPGKKSPVNNGHEAAHISPLPNNDHPIINTNNNTKN